MRVERHLNRALLAALALTGLQLNPVMAQDAERGRYLVIISGCNDCHSPGYMATDGKTPEETWLTGETFGWRGPWGTTYPPNLRKLALAITEDQWVLMAKNLKTRPPMPWFNLNQMTESDLQSIYRYIHVLGPGGEAAPAFVPPDKEPNPPYAVIPSSPPQ